MDRKIIGAIGEQKVCKWYTDRKYRLLSTNFKSRFGEIDVIAKYKDTIIFIEVKTRSSNKFMNASDAVDYKKQERIKKTALLFLQSNNFTDEFIRFDVAEVYYNNNQFEINIIENAFE